MSSAVAELETNLQAMLALKPPGVSGSKISAVTSLCVNNVQSESVLIQKIFTHFKKAPGDHKLGVLYVVDSVTRKWLEQAKQRNQAVNSSAPDGTYGAGVHRVTELLPILMNDITQSAPQDHKEKIKKLVDIWEKGQTFPMKMIESFKEKLNKESFTPPGSPPANPLGPLNVPASNAGLAPAPAPAPATPVVPANIMEALASIARQPATTAQNASVPALALVPAASYTTSAPSSSSIPISLPPFANPTAPGLPFMQTPQQPAPSVSASALPFVAPVPQGGPAANPTGFQNAAVNAPNGFLGAPAPSLPAGGGGAEPPNLQLALLQTLLAQRVPLDQITRILAAVPGNGNNGAVQATPAPQVPQPSQSSYSAPSNGGWAPPRPDGSRDVNGYDSMRSPNGARGRSRSRSPGRRWDSRDSPRGRDDRRFGDYDRNSPPRDHFDDRDRGRNRGSDYRQRSPQGRRHEMPPFQAEKWTEFDSTLPNGHIKVLSRTLFVGGVTCSESELRDTFSRFGDVQTCIVNKEKRHAFVKMFTRKDAVNARQAMEAGRNPDVNLRTRWGVGFGPRDCSDYSTGISVIPIAKLTEADRKWMLTAPYGGSGGKPITTGLVVEEPDIEIGAGVSSKAISRRMQTDKSGNHGPKSSRDEDSGHRGNDRGGRHGRRRGDHRRDDDRSTNSNSNDAAQPKTPDFPFGIQVGPNGMPIFPPGFKFPAPEQNATLQY